MTPGTAQMTVGAREKGMPLVDFLAARLSLSKKRAKALLNTKNVFVNGKRVWMAHHTLRQRDRVDTGGAPRQTAAAAPPVRIPLLHEDDCCLVVNKPAGILSNGQDSVEQRLRRRLDSPLIRVVHRLDRHTTGCLLVARTPAAFKRLVQCFQNNEVGKQYHAIVHGRLVEQDGSVTSPLDGQRAITRFRTLDSSATATHLLLRIETGRTHQIRKHMASIGHPLFGDHDYSRRLDGRGCELAVERQMLHASGIVFKHPESKAVVRVSAPLPRDFRSWLRKLRLT